MVVWNGVPIRKGLRSRAMANVIAEKWQGSYAHNKGLLKHKDKGDWIEVKRDSAAERDFDERYDVMLQGSRQRVVVQTDTDQIVG